MFQDCIDKINIQIDKIDADLEAIQVKKKKDRDVSKVRKPSFYSSCVINLNVC